MSQLDLLIIRHGPTTWNREKRLQGHTDIPVDLEAMQQQWPNPVPVEWQRRRWFCSPLIRAKQTATYLNLNALPEPALIEMSWGKWEGARLDELREEDPAGVQRIEAQGLHLRAPDGESPADVQQRLGIWAESVLSSQSSLAVGAVCHKGVIRALLAAATDWDMMGKAPVKLDYSCGHEFSWCSGRWALTRANIVF